MDERLSNLESRVDRLSQQVSDLERRMSRLDWGEIAAPAPAPVAPASASDFGAIFSLSGRALLALGGAYLLRALTEAEALPQLAGVLLAAVYAVGAVAQNAGLSTAAALTVQLALFLGYVGVFFRRNVVERKEATVFEMAQGGAATLIGYGGATAVAETTLALTAVLVVGLASALACYGAVFRLLSSTGEWRTRIFFSGLALSIALIATGASLARPAWFWAILAVLCFALGRRIEAIALSQHGGVYLVAAAAASGLLQFSLWALAAPSTTAWPSFSSSSFLVLAAGLASSVVGVPEAADWGRWSRLPRALALCVTLLGASAVAMLFLSPAAGADSARLAALRTAVLAVASVGLAAVSRGTRMKEAVWLSYALLVFCGIKLVVEDFPRGRPGTLFLGLGFYGAALILAPRLARRAP